MATRLSQSMEDYLKAIYLEEEDAPEGAVATAAIADRLGVSAASATNMLKKLHSLGLVEHAPYRGGRLPGPGKAAALEVIRHHRLLEAYLAHSLGLPWEELHGEAEVLEHALSEKLEEHIAAYLGDPTVDPHGDPIPSRELEMPFGPRQNLWEQADGGTTTVARVSDADSRLLTYLAELGVAPGVTLQVVRRGPVSGPLFIKVGGTGKDHALSKEMAESIWVS